MNSKLPLIVACSGTYQIAQSLASQLQLPWIQVETAKFPNEELKIHLSPIPSQVILLGSLSKPVNTRIIEYLLVADAAKRMGATQLIGILSWYAYSKQDKVFLPGEPLSAQVIATLLNHSPLTSLLTLELHNPQISQFFTLPSSNLSATTIFTNYLKTLPLSNSVIVSPDYGSVAKVRDLSQSLSLPIIYATKKRCRHTGKVTVESIEGDLKHRHVIIYDDMVASGSTLIEISHALKHLGADTITACVTHHLYLDNAQSQLDDSPIDQIITTNSILKPESIYSLKLKILDIASVFADHLLKDLSLFKTDNSS